MADVSFTCPVCLDVVAGARVASCGHVYCGTCYYGMTSRVVTPTCAVCRAVLLPLAYPSFEIDATLLEREGEDYKERVRVSRLLSRERESKWSVINENMDAHIVRLRALDVGDRCNALNGLLRMLNHGIGFTCQTLGDRALRSIVVCGTSPTSRDELILSWRLMAHAATYFSDATRLLTAGLADAALDAIFSREASVASRRAVTLAVAALATTSPSSFQKYLQEDIAFRLLSAAPALLAHVALKVQGGLELLARDNVLAHLLPVVVAHERVLARDLMSATLHSASEECKSHARRASAIMLCDPLVHAEQLAAVAWQDRDAAMVFANFHYRDVYHAVREASAADHYDAQMAILDFLHALQDVAGLNRPIIAVEVYKWMRKPGLDRHVRSMGLTYVSSCCKRSVASAAAVAEECGGPTPLVADETDDALVYLAGDIFSHEAVALTHEEALEHSVREMKFGAHAPLYFAASIVAHPVGVRVVTDFVLDIMRERAAASEEDEVNAETARTVVLACEREL